MMVVNLVFSFICGFFISQNQSAAGIIISILLSIIFPIIYYIYFLVKYSATPGKMALGIKIICLDNDRISVMKALGRNLSEILSGITLGIGYIIAAFDSEKRALHDRICNTRVVRK